MAKIKTRIISKSHAYLQTMAKTCAKFQKDRYKIELRSQGTHCHNTFIESAVRKWKFPKWKKWQKLMQGLYRNHIYIFRPWRKRVQSLKKIGIKLYEELRSQGTHCLYIEVEKWVHKVEKVTKNNLTKSHAHHDENTSTVSKRLVQRRSCVHKTARVNVDGWTDERMDGQTDGNLHA